MRRGAMVMVRQDDEDSALAGMHGEVREVDFSAPRPMVRVRLPLYPWRFWIPRERLEEVKR